MSRALRRRYGRSRALRRRYGHAQRFVTKRYKKGDTGASVWAFELGLDRKGAEYDWPAALRVAKRETGSNALQTALQILHWGPDGQQLPALTHEPATDVRGAIKRAEALVAAGDRMAKVRGVASRLYAMRGFGDRASFQIALVEAGDGT